MHRASDYGGVELHFVAEGLVKCGSIGDTCYFYILRCDKTADGQLYRRLFVIFRGTNSKRQLFQELAKHKMVPAVMHPPLAATEKCKEKHTLDTAGQGAAAPPLPI